MTALSNPRHERFAQKLAKGKSQADAYQAAGYTPSEPNASRLTRNDKVQARVRELQERSAIRTEITVASITERLERIADAAQAGAMPEEGKPDAPLLNVARQAAMDIAKLNGLVVDQSKVQTLPADVSDQPLTEDQWASQSPAGHA